MDYVIALSDNLYLTNSGEFHSLWQGDGTGGSQVLDALKEYAVVDDLLIGTLDALSHGSGPGAWVAEAAPFVNEDGKVSVGRKCRRVSGLDFGEGFFIIDMTWSNRLKAIGVVPAVLDPNWDPPPTAFFPLAQESQWVAALEKLGVKTPVPLTTPSEWQATIWTPTWVVWSLTAVAWAIWYVRLLRKPWGDCSGAHA